MRFWVEITVAFLLTALIAGVAHADSGPANSAQICAAAGVYHPSCPASAKRIAKAHHGLRYFGTPAPSLVKHLQRHYQSLNQVQARQCIGNGQRTVRQKR